MSVRLAKTLEDLVDSPNPQNVLKFRLVCEFEDSGDVVRASYLIMIKFGTVSFELYKFKVRSHYSLTLKGRRRRLSKIW